MLNLGLSGLFLECVIQMSPCFRSLDVDFFVYRSHFHFFSDREEPNSAQNEQGNVRAKYKNNRSVKVSVERSAV